MLRRREMMSDREERRAFPRYALWYTLLFIPVAALVFLPFMRTGKSFVWEYDGLSQVMARLSFLSKGVREGIASVLAGEGWTFPLYPFQNGITAPNIQYGPLQALAVLWPYDGMESFYQFYVLIEYYLTGLSFLYFGCYFRQKPAPCLTGAVSYAFCGYALYAGVRHPHFLTPMIMLPLLIAGAEKVLRRERGWLLTAAVGLSVTALFGVYFSCMQAVLVGLYVCVRFFDLYREDRPRQFVRTLGRLAAWGGTGALLGCATAVPTLLEILGGERIGADVWDYTNALWYGKDYYIQFFTRFLAEEQGIGYWMELAFSVLTVPALFLLFLRPRRGERTLRALFLILTAMHMIPAVAYVMSGFSNVSNRFSFGYAFCVSAALMFTLPRLAELTGREGKILGAAVAVYVCVCVGAFLYDRELSVLVAVAALLLAMAAVYVCRFGAGRRFARLTPPLCLAVTCVSVICTAFLMYDPLGGDYVESFCDRGQDALGTSQFASMSQSAAVAEDDGFFRVMGSQRWQADPNYAFYFGLNSFTSYPYYGTSQAYIRWLREMEQPRCGEAHRFGMFERQAEMLALAGVKYYASRDGGGDDWPYGFQKVDEIENGDHTDVILENENWLPLGYTYDRYISREDYDELNALEKREALMQAAVLDTAPRTAAVEYAKDISLEARQVPCEIGAADGVVWEDGKLKVGKANATLTLTFQGLPETETYLRVAELDLTSGASGRNWRLTAATDRTSASGYWYADAHVYANRQHTQLLDLGYSKEGVTSVTLTFPQKGTFRLEDLQIWCQSMDGLAARTAALRAEPLENIKTNWRGLTGTVSVSKDKILCLSLPWLDGWTAYVDGQEVPLLHVNSAFMGVELPAGEHTVELRYWLPGLTAGLALTGLGALCLAGLAAFGRKRRQNGKGDTA